MKKNIIEGHRNKGGINMKRPTAKPHCPPKAQYPDELAPKTNKEIFEIMKPPFTYNIESQQIWSDNGNLVLNVRGWGIFQYKKNGIELQDKFGEFVAKALNDAVK